MEKNGENLLTESAICSIILYCIKMGMHVYGTKQIIAYPGLKFNTILQKSTERAGPGLGYLWNRRPIEEWSE